MLALLANSLQEAVERVLPLVPAKNIFVITTKRNCRKSKKNSFRKFERITSAEPAGRDTCAPVAAWRGVGCVRVRRWASGGFARRPRYSRREKVSADFVGLI